MGKAKLVESGLEAIGKLIKAGKTDEAAAKWLAESETARSGIAVPSADRLSMDFRKVTDRNPYLQEAARQIEQGSIYPELYRAIQQRVKPSSRFKDVPTPVSMEDALFALQATDPRKVPQWGKTADILAGAPTESRLDIPAYQKYGAWIPSIRDLSQDIIKTVYGPTSAQKNVKFISPVHKALEVAKGGAKGPWAVLRGDWNPMTAEEAYARAKEVIDHPEWVQIGYDPEKSGFFHNRETMEPYTHADETIQIGPLVLARNPTNLLAPGTFKYKLGGVVKHNYAEGGEVHMQATPPVHPLLHQLVEMVQRLRRLSNLKTSRPIQLSGTLCLGRPRRLHRSQQIWLGSSQ